MYKGRRDGSLVVAGCVGGCYSDTSQCVGDGGVVVAESFLFGASFTWCIEKKIIISNCATKVMAYMCVNAYMYVL